MKSQANNAHKVGLRAVVPFLVRSGLYSLVAITILLCIQIFAPPSAKPLWWWAHQDAAHDYIQARGDIEIENLQRQIATQMEALEIINRRIAHVRADMVHAETEWSKNCDLVDLLAGGLCDELKHVRFDEAKADLEQQRAAMQTELAELEERYATLRSGRAVFQFGNGPATPEQPEFTF